MGAADELKAQSQPDAMLDRDRQLGRAQAELKTVQAKLDAAVAQIESLEQQNALLAELDKRPVSKARGGDKGAPAGEATAGIVLSDWHIEEHVESEKVFGLNAFDLDVAAARIEWTFEWSLKLLEDARGLAIIDDLVVALLGDFFSGWIHEELVEGNLLAPQDAAWAVSEHIETGLRTLLKRAKVKRIRVPCCMGNHGRSSQKKRIATAAENSYEYNMYRHLARRFADDDRVEFLLTRGYFNWVDIQGRETRFHHGDAVRYWGGSGGITIPANKAIAAWNKSKRAVYDFFGDKHQFLWHWNWVCNGSLIGYNPYAINIKAEYQPPVQTFFVIDQKRGLTRALPIHCE